MAPQLARVAAPFSIPVYSSGGFDSATVKHDAGKRIADRDRPTIVLHVGDYDPSGCAIFDSLADDVSAFVGAFAGDESIVAFRRIAVTPEQIAAHNLPTSPPKKNDKGGDFKGGTVQAEALPPDLLAKEVREAIEGLVDEKARQAVISEENAERIEILDRLDHWEDANEDELDREARQVVTVEKRPWGDEQPRPLPHPWDTQ